MYIYIYIYTYIACACAHMHIHTHLHTKIHTDINSHTSMHVSRSHAVYILHYSEAQLYIRILAHKQVGFPLRFCNIQRPWEDPHDLQSLLDKGPVKPSRLTMGSSVDDYVYD